MSQSKSPIAITMGCPVGIGPEIILRFLSMDHKALAMQPVVLGDAGVLRRCAKDLGVKLAIHEWQASSPRRDDVLNVLSLSNLPDTLSWGKPSPETGKAMGSYINEAVRMIGQGELSAMVTCPITKTALNAGGYHYPGHTEMLAELCRTEEYAMMMAGDRLRVTLVSIHQAISTVPEAVTIDSVIRMIRITGTSLKQDFGITQPRIGVAGLNPHAGEDGMFGQEEQLVITPAIKAAQDEGWLASGPFPPDTIFFKAAQGQYDAVVCMYHDQGLIPFKLIHFADGVNVTVGLPIVRTSVDHGTAYDISGKGTAEFTSLAAAFYMAEDIRQNRSRLAG